MYCDTNSRAISIFLIHFLGGLCVLITSYLSDRFGRKIFIILIVLTGILGSILLLIPSGLIISAIGVAFGNFLVDFMILIGLTYYAEISTKNTHVLSNVIMFTSVVFGSFICLMIASFTSGFFVIDVVVLILLIPLLILSLAMRETLYFLYNNREKREFFSTMKLISEINEVKLDRVFSQLHPKMAGNEIYQESFQNKNKFNSNSRGVYSYRDFSKDFNEFSMRATEYNKDNPFESLSREGGLKINSSNSKGNSSDREGKLQNLRANMFNYSIDRKYVNDSLVNDQSNNGISK